MAKDFITAPKKSIWAKIFSPFAIAWKAVSNAFYDLSVKIAQFFRKITKADQKQSTVKGRFVGEFIFVHLLLLYPLIQFAICYVSVNVNSILMSFQYYVDETIIDGVLTPVNTYYYKAWPEFFENFTEFFSSLAKNDGTGMTLDMVSNSFIAYAVTTFIGLPLNLLFSYVIYKKVPASGFFQVMLYLPQMVSSIVVSMIFCNFVNNAIPTFMRGIVGDLSFPIDPMGTASAGEGAFGINLFYSIWGGFGTQLILYAGAMARIPDSLIEFGELEGISMFKEFIFVVLPMIYSTITVFLVTGIAGIFTNQLSLYNFYGGNASPTVQTLGYYIYAKVVGNGGDATAAGHKSDYPEAAAAGLVFTIIVAPITLVGRHLLEKYGPTVEF